MNKPLLSIASIAYNHEEFIVQAIDSWLMQKTKFDFEIVIGEDCSTDNTLQIIKEYQRKQPDLIKIITSGKNEGMHANFTRTLKACKGTYIALCEGDDYWTDSTKLQKQVDFLESNNDYSGIAHGVDILYEDVYDKEIPFIDRDIDTLEDAFNYFYPTCSLVFRKCVIRDEIINLVSNLEYLGGDKVTLLVLFKNGRLKYCKYKMAVYRKHKGGISYSGKMKKQLIGIGSVKSFNIFKRYFKNKEYNAFFNLKLLISNGDAALIYRKQGKLLKYLIRLLKASIYIRKYTDIKLFVKDFVIN